MILKHKNHLLSEGTGGLFAGWLPILVEEATPQHLANLQWTGERMPLSLWKMVKGFFKWTQDTYGCEAQVRLFYHPEPMGLPRWLAVPYPQTIRSGLSTHELDHHEEFTALQDAILGQGYQPNGSVHHHCTASAFQSRTDFRDEEFQIGIHITLGHLNCVVLSEDTRAVFRGVMYPKLDLQRFICPAEDEEAAAAIDPRDAMKILLDNQEFPFPEAWKDRLHKEEPRYRTVSPTYLPSEYESSDTAWQDWRPSATGAYPSARLWDDEGERDLPPGALPVDWLRQVKLEAPLDQLLDRLRTHLRVMVRVANQRAPTQWPLIKTDDFLMEIFEAMER